MCVCVRVCPCVCVHVKRLGLANHDLQLVGCCRFQLCVMIATGDRKSTKARHLEGRMVGDPKRAETREVEQSRRSLPWCRK